MILGLLALIVSSGSAFAIPESNYEAVYASSVVPYFETGKAGTLEGKKGVRLAFRTYEVQNELAKLVILPGRTEPLRRYAELLYDLKDLGYSVYLLEHRGQGESDRMLKDPEIQYVQDFNDYIDDVDAFIKKVVRPNSSSKLLLLAHSMGGPIGTLYMIKHPGVFRAAVLSAPMFEINTMPFPQKVAYFLSEAASKAGRGDRYAIGQGHYHRRTINPLKILTSSRPRQGMTVSIFENYPETRMGGVSYQWLFESFKALSSIQELGHTLTTPTLLFQAGHDWVVKSGGQDSFCQKALFCEKSVFAKARHEILMEKDVIRNQALSEMSHFFSKAVEK